MIEPLVIWHEVSNSLTAVNLTLEFLSQKYLALPAGQVQEELQFSLHSLDHIRNVLLMAGTKSKKADFVEEIDLHELIEDVTKILQRKWRNAEFELEQKYPYWRVKGNKTKLTQVFMNIFINAIESYGNADLAVARRVNISLKKKKKSPEIEVLVQDWGRGVPNSIRAHIFEPFCSSKKSEGGTGIGLALCKQVVEEEFGGSIRFSSRVGKGSVFTICLPVEGRK